MKKTAIILYLLIFLFPYTHAQQQKATRNLHFPVAAPHVLDSMYAKDRRIIEIEELQRPDSPIKEDSVIDIYRNLVLSGMNKEWLKGREGLSYDIIAHYNGPDKLVYPSGTNVVFAGMRKAYNEHRPFVLSPDIVWTMIMQGFAHHINSNPEAFRKHLVKFDGKMQLLIHQNRANRGKTWEELFSIHAKQIAMNTNQDIANILDTDFSTSSPVTKAVSQITVMYTMRNYFDYLVSVPLCGIPEVILEGTPEDWEKILKKSELLRKYELEWWIDELQPVLTELVEASKGNINNEFWRNMFKFHRTMDCMNPDFVDGWIVKFFPYYERGEKANLKKISIFDNIAESALRVDLKYIFYSNNQNITVPLEIWAGFMGLRQDTVTYALKPELGWMIHRKDGKLSSEILNIENERGHISIYTDKVPDDLFKLKNIESLSIQFENKIDIPYKMKTLNIKELSLHGKITEKEIVRICKLLPDTEIRINYTYYDNKGVKIE